MSAMWDGLRTVAANPHDMLIVLGTIVAITAAGCLADAIHRGWRP